ncbi:septum formation family protein [Plantibacter flavus]|uniref:septum formation family protein n=1 Tax=Plantibacter flavus TaxID=150123 RepID=UPI003F5CF42B
MTARRLLPLAIAAVVAALTLSGCSVINDILPKPAETRDSQTGEIVGGGTTNVFTLAVGDCLNDESSSDEVSEVPTVPCTEPHTYEVYGEVTIPGDEWPGDDALTQQADDGCYAQFQPFAGIAYEDSTLDFNYYTPTQASWEEMNDRLVTCVIFDSGATTGSLAGAAR